MLSDVYWKVYSQCVYRTRFRQFGWRSWIRHPLVLTHTRSIEVGNGCFVRDGARIQVLHRPGLPPGRLRIGNRVSIEQGAHIIACDDVKIDDDVTIGPRCTIVEAVHPAGHDGDGSRVAGVSESRTFIHIGQRAFLGANVVVMPNVTIGAHSIVGANAVVTHDVPPHAVVGGVPAVLIRMLDEP